MPEWIQVVATAISAIAAAAAAVAAFWSIRAAAESRRESQAWRHAEKRHFYYDAIVAQPVFEAVREQRKLLGDLLEARAREIQRMQEENAGIQDVQAAVNQLVNEEFAQPQVALTDAITEAVEAWPDPSPREALQEAVASVEEAVGQEAAKLLDVGAKPNFAAA